MKVAELGRNDLAPRVISCGNRANTMGAFFSSIDDKYELDDPGIHLTVGKINTAEMKYEIAASVVGNRRRFIVSYTDLVDATPVADVTFHEDVLSYVDFTSPTTYRAPAPKPATSNIIKKLPPAKNQKTYDSIDDYFKDRYGSFDEDYSWDMENYGAYMREMCKDPFYYQDGYVGSTESPNDVPDAQRLNYQVIDLLEDHLKEIRNDSDTLEEFKQQLASFLIEIELELSR